MTAQTPITAAPYPLAAAIERVICAVEVEQMCFDRHLETEAATSEAVDAQTDLIAVLHRHGVSIQQFERLGELMPTLRALERAQ